MFSITIVILFIYFVQAYHRKYHQKNVVFLVNFWFSKDWWKNIEYKSGTKNCSSNDIEVILKGSIGLLHDGYILLENNDTITASGMVCVYNYDMCYIAQWDAVLHN